MATDPKWRVCGSTRVIPPERHYCSLAMGHEGSHEDEAGYWVVVATGDRVRAMDAEDVFRARGAVEESFRHLVHAHAKINAGASRDWVLQTADLLRKSSDEALRAARIIEQSVG